MYELEFKVLENGRVVEPFKDRIQLGVQGSRGAVTLMFDVEDAIAGDYRYVKFYHPKRTLIEPVINNQIVVSPLIFELAGLWELSYIATNQEVNDGVFNGDYLFVSEAIVVTVAEGILGDISPNEAEYIAGLKADMQKMKNFERDLFANRLNTIEIPNHVTTIGPCFGYKRTGTAYKLKVGSEVTSIGSYAFYDSQILREIMFSYNGKLKSIGDYAFALTSFLPTVPDVVIPNSVNDYGRYIFYGGGVSTKALKFEEGSQIQALLANSFNNVLFKEIYLPDNLKKFSAQNAGTILRDCENLVKLWIPNTVNEAIPAVSIKNCPKLSDIVLQDGFNISANFTNVTSLSHDSIVAMFNALKNRVGNTPYVLALGDVNLAKVTDSEKAIALNKNWTLA